MKTITPRETLDRAIDEILQQVLIQGSMVENALRDSVTALKNRNIDDAKIIYDGDRQINKKHFDISRLLQLASSLLITPAVVSEKIPLLRTGLWGKYS